MNRVAVLGANGFIGSRIVEMFHLGNAAEVRPIVRTISSLARLSRFDLDGRIADALDRPALTAAFAGCEAVVHAVAGSPTVIVGTLEPVYQAAQEAGVRRLIYLSSAAVHGQTPEPGATEEWPLHDHHPLPYNNAKVRAERTLQRLRQQGDVELVILRPGIVFGPRSFWVANFADGLLSGQAYLINEGQGICNSTYVDNLVHAIHLAMMTEGVDGQAFLVGDGEQVTWWDLYRPIADALGFDLDQVPQVEPSYRRAWEDRFKTLHASRPAQTFLSLFPFRFRLAAFNALTALKRSAPYPSPWVSPPLPRPQATLEMSLLYQCRYKLPSDKAARMLSYQPIVSFAEGCRRSVAWLDFAGYRVLQTHQCSNPGQPGRQRQIT
jgi:nucleoside-diphosphate-sugar epimerase